MRSAPLTPPLALLLSLACLTACREGFGRSSSIEPIPLSLFGSNGCLGDDQAFGSLAAVAFAQLAIGPESQLAAAADTLAQDGTYELYVTGAGATLVEFVFDPSDPLNPVSETLLLAPGDVDALAEYAGIAAPAELSGVAVLDPGFLVVVEKSGNTLLLVNRDVPGDVDVFPALVPDEAAGNADGTASLIRFAFSSGTQLLATGDGRIFLADPGNHSIRALLVAGLAQSATLAGSGAAFFADGGLDEAGFDTPVGLTLGCDGALVVAESGAAGNGGHRLRALSLLNIDEFSGEFTGEVVTLVGDGNALTVQGVGPAASAAGPQSPITSAQDQIYWVDSLTGVLRRFDRDTGIADCPMFADCASATAALGSAPNFTSQGGEFSLAVTEDGSLYALDADAQELWRVQP